MYGILIKRAPNRDPNFENYPSGVDELYRGNYLLYCPGTGVLGLGWTLGVLLTRIPLRRSHMGLSDKT